MTFLIVSSIIILASAIYSVITAKSGVNYTLAIGIILFILVLAGVITKSSVCMLGVVIVAIILIITAIVNLVLFFMDDRIKFFSLGGIVVFIILVVFLCLSCHICYAGNALRASY
ncbi:hypothetical protein GCK32_016575 [Trichostrongylus colubriformis]|uniref:Uncharacterized protein n=1 Tax=Trichostrongylus colubriformis TaxID=6319 RepID=A0AAN8FRA2_TRICO